MTIEEFKKQEIERMLSEGRKDGTRNWRFPWFNKAGNL